MEDEHGTEELEQLLQAVRKIVHRGVELAADGLGWLDLASIPSLITDEVIIEGFNDLAKVKAEFKDLKGSEWAGLAKYAAGIVEDELKAAGQ